MRCLALLGCLTITLLSGCAAGPPPVAPPAGPLEVRRVVDLDARGEDGHFTFFSLRDGRVVSPEDSASTAWDVAFRATTILVNGGASGPGRGGIALLAGTSFAEVESAPDDEAFAVASDRGPALLTGAGRGWYDYDVGTGIVEPRPAVLVIRTADGRFARLRIQSYYRGAPSPAELDPRTGFRYYTFEYVFQPDGSRLLR
jgi:hypothetical protein